MAETPEPDTVINQRNSTHDSNPPTNTNGRPEIDTSVPFESVREAATRFGGFGFWKPSQAFQETNEEDDMIMEIKAEAFKLKNVLISKEIETAKVLKELEEAKAKVEELKQRNEEVHAHVKPAGIVLKDLNQAKMNLCKRTVDLASVRASVNLLNKMLKEERFKLEKTRERISMKSLEVSSLEEEEKRVRFAKEKDLEVVKAMAEIKRTREKIKTVKIELIAARKMKEAARAGEAVANAEIKAVTAGEDVAAVTISVEEYDELVRNGRKAEEEARKRVDDAMSRVEEANVSKSKALKMLEKSAREVETSKREFEEATERFSVSNAEKLEAEEAIRMWRLENGQRRRSSSVNNTAKFKSRRESSSRQPTMSIGQILSKKLLPEEDMNVACDRRKTSLGQLLAKNSKGDRTTSERKENEKSSFTRKRKKFGFAKISVLLNKRNKNKKTT